MKGTKKIISLLLVFVLVFGLAACGNSGDSTTEADSPGEVKQESKQTIVWDYLSISPNGHPEFILMNEWSDRIYEQTDGQLKINIRLGGELPFTNTEYLDAVSAGSVQMAGCLINAISSYLQAMGLPSCPYMITDVDTFRTVMGALDKYREAEFSSYGVTNLMNTFFDTQDVYGTGPLPKTYNDLKGIKMRTSGAEQGKFWQAVGINPVAIDAAEISTALSTKTVDAITTSPTNVLPNKWYEVLDWVYMCNSMYIPIYSVVNDAALAALPDDVREVFLSVTKAFNDEFPDRMQAASEECIQALQDNGLVPVWATDQEKAELRAIAMPLWDAFAANAGGQAEDALADIKKALGL